MISKIAGLGFRLMIVCFIAAVGLGFTYSVTKGKIAEQQGREETEACMDALPGVKDVSELKEDKELERKVRKHIPDIEKVFLCDKGDIIIVKAKGYGGPIRMAVGIGKDGEVKGIAVISQNETPGLGANIEKEEFLEQFKGKTYEDKIVVKEDIKPITGATITSKAAAKEVREALEAFQEIEESD